MGKAISSALSSGRQFTGWCQWLHRPDVHQHCLSLDSPHCLLFPGHLPSHGSRQKAQRVFTTAYSSDAQLHKIWHPVDIFHPLYRTWDWHTPRFCFMEVKMNMLPVTLYTLWDYHSSEWIFLTPEQVTTNAATLVFFLKGVLCVWARAVKDPFQVIKWAHIWF